MQAHINVATEHMVHVTTEHVIWEVAFNNGMWWEIPPAMSQGITHAWLSGEPEVCYTWDWGDSREGSWRPDGESTSISRYIIDFVTMYQRNIDNNRTRHVRAVTRVNRN